MRFSSPLLLLLIFSSPLNAGDLKVTTARHYSKVLHNRTDPNVFPDEDWKRTEVVYVHGPERRFEFVNRQPPLITSPMNGLANAAIIENCETRELITIDLDAHEYLRASYPSDESMRVASAERVKRGKSDWSSGKMSVDTKTVDTGETMPLLGHVAHHFVTTSHEIPLGEAVVMIGMRRDTTLEAWYIDVPVTIRNRGCQPADVFASEMAAQQSAHGDEKRSGPVPKGFPVTMKRTSHISTHRMPSGYTEIDETTVTELSQAALDPSLFAVPPGYKLVTCLRGQPCAQK